MNDQQHENRFVYLSYHVNNLRSNMSENKEIKEQLSKIMKMKTKFGNLHITLNRNSPSKTTTKIHKFFLRANSFIRILLLPN